MRKVIFLRVARGPLESYQPAHQTALVLQKSADGFVIIQGHSPVAWQERQRCWDLFRKAAKLLLGLREKTKVSLSLSEPPCTTISDLTEIFRQPCHIVSLTLSILPDMDMDMDADTASWNGEAKKNRSGSSRSWPRVAASGAGGLPQAKRGAKAGGKDEGKDMTRLLWQLDQVSQCLERTQHECQAIARRCEQKRGKEVEEADYSTKVTDSHVEHLLKVAETLTSRIIIRKSPTPEGSQTQVRERGETLPDCPKDVCVQPSVSGGAYVLWNPVRLDVSEQNCGHKVLGYAVYVDSALRCKVMDPISSHSIVSGLENGIQYQFQVSTLCEDCESSLSLPALYSHSVPTPVLPLASSPSQSQKGSQSAKVKNWLLSSQSNHSTPTGLEGDEGVATHVRLVEGCCDGGEGKVKDTLTTPPDSTHLQDDIRSLGSSHTSGIVMDLPPSNMTPLHPSYSNRYSLQSDCTAIIDGSRILSNKDSASLSHRLRFTPSPSPSPSPSSTPSRPHSTYSAVDHAADTQIDEPLDFPDTTMVCNKAVSSVQLVASSMRCRGPAPPENVCVRCKQPGYMTVSWTPTRRDAKGCSNNCFVLGYRVYVNGMAQMSMDGPMSCEATVRCPAPDISHKLLVHVRTRSIAAESSPSPAVVYDMILQESLDPYSGGSKVNSTLSSTATLCAGDQLHSNSPSLRQSPLPLTTTHTHTAAAVSVETYV